MPSVEELRLALAAAELEQELIAAKGTKNGASRELKQRVSEARRAYRELRQGRPAEAGDARPDTIAATATTNSPGSN